MIDKNIANILTYSKKLEREEIDKLARKAIDKAVLDKYFVEVPRFRNINHIYVPLR